MDKQEILKGMKMARKKQDQRADDRYVLRSEYDTDTSTTSSGYKIYIGTTQPEDPNTIWFDTSGY